MLEAREHCENGELPAGGRKDGFVSPDGSVHPFAAIAMLARSLLARGMESRPPIRPKSSEKEKGDRATLPFFPNPGS